MKRKKTTKKKKLAERVAYNLRFSLIRLNYKAKMQLYEAKQAKRVVIEPINTPRTKKINGSFFGFRNLGEGLCDEWVLSASVCGTGSFSAHTATHSTSGSAHEAQSPSPRLRKPKKVPSPLVKPPLLCYNKYINKRRGIMEQFLTDDDLLGLLEELDQEDAEIEELEFEMEMEASNRRYEEIIQKHRMV